MNKTLWIGLAIVALFAGIGMTKYNGMVSSNEDVDAQWGKVQSAYQQRADLIPNLVETAKGYANFEQSVLTQVAEARASVGKIQVSPEIINNPEAMKQFNDAQGQLGVAMSRLMSVAENYPELKANQNFVVLMSQLEGTENRIRVERNKYNEVAAEYNKTVKQFPNNLFAGIFGFEKKEYFEAEAAAQSAPKVKF